MHQIATTFQPLVGHYYLLLQERPTGLTCFCDASQPFLGLREGCKLGTWLSSKAALILMPSADYQYRESNSKALRHCLQVYWIHIECGENLFLFDISLGLGTHATDLFQLVRLRLTDISICWDIYGNHCQQAYAVFEKASELEQYHFHMLFSWYPPQILFKPTHFVHGPSICANLTRWSPSTNMTNTGPEKPKLCWCSGKSLP